MWYIHVVTVFPVIPTVLGTGDGSSHTPDGFGEAQMRLLSCDVLDSSVPAARLPNRLLMIQGISNEPAQDQTVNVL